MFLTLRQTGNEINVVYRITITDALRRNKNARPKPPPKNVEEVVVEPELDSNPIETSDSEDDGKSTGFHSISATLMVFNSSFDCKSSQTMKRKTMKSLKTQLF